MANRSIELMLKANVQGLVNGLKTAQTAASNAGRDLDSFRKNNEQSWNTIGTTFTAAGTAMTAAAGLSVKAAIDWESAWAGVQKTNDGTSQQMQGLEEDLRELAKTLPSTHAEIAAVAEAAGQLGVGVDDVAEFTETMINLGETTNLSAEEAATSLARFSNITGTSFADVDKLGSALVGLGNNFATTESEILHMSERLAAAGTQAGMSEGEILGMATAMSSVGIEAEAGGTAITQTFNNIDAAVREGGESLTGWAELAGTSASEFAEIWENEPAQAMDMLVQGLARVESEGGSVAGTLEELGITGIRQADVMRRLASASGILGDAFAMGNEEFDSASALAEEAALRYETTEAKITIAWNNIKDAAITAGEAILPVVGGIAESISDLAGWFSEIPGPVSGAVTAMSGVAGVASLALGGLVLLVPRLTETVDAFRRLNKQAPGASKALRNLGRAGAIGAGVAVVGSVLREVAEQSVPAAVGVESVVNALNELRDTGSMEDLDEIFTFRGIDSGKERIADAELQIEGLGDAINAVNPEGFNEHVSSFLATVAKLPSPTRQAYEQFEKLDQALATMDAETAAGHMVRLREEAEAAGNQDFSNWEDLSKIMPEYAAAVEEAATANGESVEPAELLKVAMGELTPEMQAVKDAADVAAQQDGLTTALEEVGVAADGTVDSLTDYLDLLFETGLAEMSARDAQAAYQESIDAVGDSVDQIIADHGSLGAALNKSKSDFDLTTQAGRDANTAFQGLAQSGLDAASAMAENGASQEEVQAHLEGTYDSLIAAAGQFGITGEEADALARSVLGVPEGVSIESWMSETAKTTADETKESVRSIPDQATIDSWMSDAAFIEALQTRAAVLGIPEEDVISSFMSDAARDEAGKTTAKVLGIPEGASISSWMSDNARQEAMSTNQWLNTIDGRHTTSTHEHTNVTHNRIINSVFGSTGISSSAPGVLLPRRANGGRLPYTGLGRDQILGIGSNGRPTALVDDGEWVTREPMSRKFDGVLGAINANHPSVQHLAGYATGGRVGREWSAMSAPVAAGPVSASVDSGVIANAVASAIAGYQPVVKIGMREFIGEMKQDRAWKGAS